MPMLKRFRSQSALSPPAKENSLRKSRSLWSRIHGRQNRLTNDSLSSSEGDLLVNTSVSSTHSEGEGKGESGDFFEKYHVSVVDVTGEAPKLVNAVTSMDEPDWLMQRPEDQQNPQLIRSRSTRSFPTLESSLTMPAANLTKFLASANKTKNPLPVATSGVDEEAELKRSNVDCCGGIVKSLMAVDKMLTDFECRCGLDFDVDDTTVDITTDVDMSDEERDTKAL